MIIAQINPAFEPVAASATALVAASVIVTAILVPIITALYAKRFNKTLGRQRDGGHPGRLSAPLTLS